MQWWCNASLGCWVLWVSNQWVYEFRSVGGCGGGVVVVCVVGFCRFLINGFMGFDLLVAVVVIDSGLYIRWLWVEDREKRQRRRRREREKKSV